MHEIKCPNCSKTFKVDETSYAAILAQVHTKEFEEEIHEKLGQLKQQYETNLKLQEEKLKNERQQELSKKESEISALKTNLENKDNEAKTKKRSKLSAARGEEK